MSPPSEIWEQTALPEFSVRIVAYLDALGFKEFVDQLRKEADNPGGPPEPHRKLYEALRATGQLAEMLRDVTITAFSDSVVLSAEPRHLVSLLSEVGYLQSRMLSLGLLTRGGVAMGRTLHSNGVVFGPGVVAALRIEQTAAKYPRVVLAEEVLAEAKARNWTEQTHVVQDENVDALWFVDFMQFEGELSTLGNRVNRRTRIIEGRRKAEGVGPRGNWNWLAVRFNAALKRLGVQDVDPIPLE